jgi:2,3-bisphosphoglycerate-independent phosphoglycerate mutase
MRPLTTPRLTTPRLTTPRLTRWERVQLAYDVMCRGPGECETAAAGSVAALIEAKHAADEKDEFIKPTGLVADGGLADGDVFMSFNYRADRAREMFECISVKQLFDD